MDPQRTNFAVWVGVRMRCSRGQEGGRKEKRESKQKGGKGQADGKKDEHGKEG